MLLVPDEEPQWPSFIITFIVIVCCAVFFATVFTVRAPSSWGNEAQMKRERECVCVLCVCSKKQTDVHAKSPALTRCPVCVAVLPPSSSSQLCPCAAVSLAGAAGATGSAVDAHHDRGRPQAAANTQGARMFV